MGCNCKAQNDFKKIVSKYGEETYTNSNNKIKGFFLDSIKLISVFLIGILTSILFIIMVIPMVIYVAVCIIFGIEPVVRIPWLKKQKTLEKKIKKQDEGRDQIVKDKG